MVVGRPEARSRQSLRRATSISTGIRPSEAAADDPRPDPRRSLRPGARSRRADASLARATRSSFATTTTCSRWHPRTRTSTTSTEINGRSRRAARAPRSRSTTGSRTGRPPARSSTTGASSRSTTSPRCGSRIPRSSTLRHDVILGLVADGTFDGLRVDHIDGLRDPTEYLERLRARATEAYIVVEKILEPDEGVPGAWPVEGTTGYDF